MLVKRKLNQIENNENNSNDSESDCNCKVTKRSKLKDIEMHNRF